MSRSYLYFFLCEPFIFFMNYPICCQALSYWFISVLYIWRKYFFMYSIIISTIYCLSFLCRLLLHICMCVCICIYVYIWCYVYIRDSGFPALQQVRISIHTFWCARIAFCTSSSFLHCGFHSSEVSDTSSCQLKVGLVPSPAPHQSSRGVPESR